MDIPSRAGGVAMTVDFSQIVLLRGYESTADFLLLPPFVEQSILK
jgi:hypothetical protein